MWVYILEDEVHVLLQCPAYVQIRQKYGLTESLNQPNWSHVRNILACEDELKTINLSKLLTIALDIRKKKIEQEYIFK